MSYATKIKNYSPEGEWNEEASMTQPGQAYSLKELLERAIAGQEIPTTQVDYDEDPDLDNPDPLNRMGVDLVDAMPMLDELHEIQAAAAEAQKVEEARKIVAAADASAAQPDTAEELGTSQL